MYTAQQIAELNWHPLRDVGRSGNYAIQALGYDRKGHMRYRMACGHQSVSGHSRCERGCTDAPNYRRPYVFHRDWKLYAKYFERTPEGRKIA